jgi:hypothetical protein
MAVEIECGVGTFCGMGTMEERREDSGRMWAELTKDALMPSVDCLRR